MTSIAGYARRRLGRDLRDTESLATAATIAADRKTALCAGRPTRSGLATCVGRRRLRPRDLRGGAISGRRSSMVAST